MKKTGCFILALFLLTAAYGQQKGWYYTFTTESYGQIKPKFEPRLRLVFVLKNTLNIERKNCPVIIKRTGFPLPDVHDMWVTVVDPELPPYKGPDAEVLKIYGGHQLLAEKNGHAVFHQLDDLDKDGIWDELFFQTDLKPGEEKIIYVYIGENTQGWNRHSTHANIGSYCRHQMPFWESENVGWKIWFANSVDVFAKRKPVLMAQHLYMENLDGYGVSVINRDWGSDIQSVAETMGGGAICLFEHPGIPDSISVPRFTPAGFENRVDTTLWNAGPISDTRYAYEVVVNGPVRSVIRIKTMNWDSGEGKYDLEQNYSVYANQSYSTCDVKFLNFNPRKAGVQFGCGIRKKPGEEQLIQENGVVISSGPEEVRDPEKIDNRAQWILPFIGKALVVKEIYKPEYQFTRSFGENHTFRITSPRGNGFEYMIFAAWCEGAVYNNRADFEKYVKKTSLEYNNPVQPVFMKTEKK